MEAGAVSRYTARVPGSGGAVEHGLRECPSQSETAGKGANPEAL